MRVEQQRAVPVLGHVDDKGGAVDLAVHLERELGLTLGQAHRCGHQQRHQKHHHQQRIFRVFIAILPNLVASFSRRVVPLVLLSPEHGGYPAVRDSEL